MITALLSLAFLNLVYQLGFFATSIWMNVAHKHYFLGYGSKLLSFTIRNTKFSIGMYIPIIGLARIYTVVDDKKERMVYPWEFAERSLVKRLVCTLSGVLSILLTSIIISIIYMYTRDERIITKEEANKHGIYPSEEAKKYGFELGDKIQLINGKDFDNFYDVYTPNNLLSPNSSRYHFKFIALPKIDVSGTHPPLL